MAVMVPESMKIQHCRSFKTIPYDEKNCRMVCT